MGSKLSLRFGERKCSKGVLSCNPNESLMGRNFLTPGRSRKFRTEKFMFTLCLPVRGRAPLVWKSYYFENMCVM